MGVRRKPLLTCAFAHCAVNPRPQITAGRLPCSGGYERSFASPEQKAIRQTIREVEQFMVATSTTSTLNHDDLVAQLADWYGVHPRMFRGLPLDQLTDAWIAMREPRDPCVG